MKPLFIAFLLLLTFEGLSQQYWGSVTESEFTNEALDVEIDASGNIYTTGYITGETAFNPTISFPTAQGNGDIFVAKYSSSGSLIWVKKYGANFSDRAYDLALDPNGNIIITGQFYGTVNFDGNTIVSASNSKDIFLAKLNSNGVTQWAIGVGGTGAENAYGVTCDNLGNIILTGQFEGNSNLSGTMVSSTIDPTLNVPSYDIFITKYDPNGTILWVKTASAKYEDRGLALSIDANNNIYATFQFSDTLNFQDFTLNNGAYNVGLLCKFSPSGATQWYNTIRAQMVMPYDLEVNGDELHVTGDHKGTLIYSNNGTPVYTSTPWSKSIFVFKTNLSGQHSWTKTVGSNNEISARSISVDAGKNAYITGQFKCDLTELHQGNDYLYNSVGFRDAYLAKVSPSGALTYLKTFGSKRDDYGHGVSLLNNQPILCGSNMEDLNIPHDVLSSYNINIQNDFVLHEIGGGENPHLWLEGDLSLNSFLTNAVFSTTPDLNYFYNMATDSLDLTILPSSDTIHLCDPSLIQAFPQTYPHYGPLYTYLWNTGDTGDSTFVSNAGAYNVQIERLDECSSGADTTEVVFHPYPLSPLMSDSVGLAVNAPGYVHYVYNLCVPDSMAIWFNNVDTSSTFTINHFMGSVIFSDSLPHYYSAGIYTTVTHNGWCTVETQFQIYLEDSIAYNYNPYIQMVDSTQSYGDSITVCQDDYVYFHSLDYTNNPDSTFAFYTDDIPLEIAWTITLNGTTVHTEIDNNCDEIEEWITNFAPQQTGNYVVQIHTIAGFMNSCGIDTAHYIFSDTVFIEVLNNPITPTALINGDNLLCPNGSVYLYVTNPNPAYNWSGPGVIWTSANEDSIQVTQEGTFFYGGYFVDTVTGCGTNYTTSFVLNEKQPPLIIGDPEDGIVCPYDSVLMSVPNIYLSYDWTGPSGSGLSTTNTHLDAELGFYYVTVEDNEGCMLTSPPFELKEYATPYLTVDPTNFVCPGDQLEITATVFGNGTINWLNPVSGGSAASVFVTQPGWYICEMEHCDIMVTDSIQIFDGSFIPTLNVSDTVLCFNEQTLLSTQGGMADYVWSTTEAGMSMIEITAPGQYFVTVTNSYGCVANTDTITFTYQALSEPPTIADQVICQTQNVTFTNPQTVNWYQNDSTLIQNGLNFSFFASQDSTFLVSYAPAECPVVFSEFNISIAPVLYNYSIFGDTVLCPSEDLELTTDAVNCTINWQYNGQQVGTNDTLNLSSNLLINGTSITLNLSNVCFNETITQDFVQLVTQPLSILGDSIYCPYESVELTTLENYPDVTWWMPSDSANFSFIAPNLSGVIPSGTYEISAQAIDTNGCLTVIDTFSVLVSSGFADLSSDIGLSCSGDTVNFEVLSSAIDSFIVQTPFGLVDTNYFSINISDSTEGNYFLMVWDSLGCTYFDQIYIDQNLLPTMDFPLDTILCLQDFMGNEYANDSTMIQWEGGVFDSVQVIGQQWYVVTLTSLQGCTFTDSVYVETVNCTNDLPNVFTPNSDGINDIFLIDEAIIYPNNYLIIINRWGNVVYEEHYYRNTFDGGNLVDGTYFYTFWHDYENNPGEKKSGFFHLVR